jgi:leucine dehydrogenase
MEKNMNIFDEVRKREHEQVVFCSHKESNLKAIIAIHNTTLGPALGGTRMWMYASESDALIDVLRLSRGMTYKAAVSGLNLGGGKAVIIGDPHKDKNESMFRAFGRFVDGIAGRYITAEDVGTSVEDMEYVRMETKYVTGIDKALGGSGDPSPYTAYGVYVGMKACMKELTGSDSLVGKKVAVQGAGNVAKYLCEYLAKEGSKIFVSDIYEDKVKAVAAESKAEIIAPDKIYDVDAEVFCPCALGAIVNDDTIPRMKFKIIAGGANNQLADENRHGRILLDRGIIYAPDYAVNAGGLINVAAELGGYHPERVMKQAGLIYDTIRKILEIAKKENIPTHQASNKLAEERLATIGAIRKIYSGKSEFSGRLGELTR